MLTLEQAREAIEPFETKIHEAVSRAYDRYMVETDASLRSDLLPNLGPAIITSLAVAELEREFSGDDRVQLFEAQGSRYFRIKTNSINFWVRVAKVDSEYMSSESNASERKLKYKMQLDLGLPGMERLPQLEVGYQLGIEGIKCVALIFPKLGGVNWQFDLCKPSNVIPLNFGATEQDVPEPSFKGKGTSKRKMEVASNDNGAGEN